METTEAKQELTLPEEKTPAPVAPPPKEKKQKLKAPKKKRKWIKRLIILVVIVAIIAVLLVRCMSAGNKIVAGAYISQAAQTQELTVSVSGTGTIEPIQSYKVTTLISGEVLQAPFEEGQTINKGDLLFQVDAKDVESSIKQLEISLQQMQLTYNDLLKTQSDNQKDRNLKAEAAGVITKLYVDQGDKVTIGTPIADILDRDHMKLVIPFHSADAQGFWVGQQATVTVDGTVDTVYGAIDTIAAADEVGAGGTLVRKVTILVTNPGALSENSSGTATIGGAACAAGANFSYGASKQILAKASGDLNNLNVKEGDKVFDGQIVGVIAETDLKTQIESARLQVQNAQLSLQNARDRLEDYTITSTITGTVIEKNVDVGDTIGGSSSSSVATGITYPAVIYDLSALTFDMKIDELDINKIQVGQAVEITSDALDGKTFTGHVDKININGVTAGGVTTYPVTILVDNPDELLPGMNVSAKILVEKAGNVLCIPVDAVTRGNTVLVAGPGCLDENGNVVNVAAIETREVTLGRNDEDSIEVLDGLSEGEMVLMENSSSNMMAMMMGG